LPFNINLENGAGMKNKKIALIACPWAFFDSVEFQSQQLGLGYVGAYAQQFGHQIVAFIDPMNGDGKNTKLPIKTRYQVTNRFGFSDEWIIDQIPTDTEIIGINAPFTDSRLLLYPLVKKIKTAYPSIPVVIGGVLATTLPRQVIEESGADIAVKGEGEIAFAKILNDEPWNSIPGLVYRQKNGRIFESEFRSEQFAFINEIPYPGYDFRPMKEYVRWSPRGNQADRTLSLVSSRGCPFSCEFCSIPEKGQCWRPFSSDRIIEEIKMAVDRWGVNHIEFEDDNFSIQKPRALKILGYLRDLRKKGYPIFCSFPNGIMINRMSEELAILMKDAGTEIIYLPVESGDKRILISMNKHDAEHHLEKASQVARFCVNAGLFVSCFFIVAYPGGKFRREKYYQSEYESYLTYDKDGAYLAGEDEKSFKNTLKFCRQLVSIGVQGISPLIATPYPGTELYDYCRKFNFLSFPDEKDVLTTVSYAAMRPDFVQIETPWCSRAQAFERWKTMKNMFPTFYNVRK